MKDLLEAITIMSKYTDDEYPCNCDHDIIVFNTINIEDVSEEDFKRLEKLSFSWHSGDQHFYSFRFGSN